MNTKRNMSTILCLSMAALLITTAVAGRAAAGGQVPFNGSIAGTENFTFLMDDPDGIDLKISGSGEGNSALLGEFTATWDADIIFDIEQSPVVRTFVAENGDQIWSEGLAAGTPPDPDQFVVGNFDIIGGTGQFAGATGSFTVERTVFNVAPPFTDLVTTGGFDGTINIVPEPAGIVLATTCMPLFSLLGWRRRRQQKV